MNSIRGVAQPGSALRSGRRGRRFESYHPDSFKWISGIMEFFKFVPYHFDQREKFVNNIVEDFSVEDSFEMTFYYFAIKFIGI